MSKPTPNDYIVYRVHRWYESGSAVIAAPTGKKDAAKRAHHVEIRELRNAVDIANRNGAPVIQSESGSGEP
ncbi:MAG TPA: hypothetical protein VN081_06780 [Dongiaceae bacterium]|nr:hypothetical protein [Dongiaceae bacterium]